MKRKNIKCNCVKKEIKIDEENSMRNKGYE